MLRRCSFVGLVIALIMGVVAMPGPAVAAEPLTLEVTREISMGDFGVSSEGSEPVAAEAGVLWAVLTARLSRSVDPLGPPVRINFEIESGPLNQDTPGHNEGWDPDLWCTVYAGSDSCPVLIEVTDDALAELNNVRAWIENGYLVYPYNGMDILEERDAGTGDCVAGIDDPRHCGVTAEYGSISEPDSTDVVQIGGYVPPRNPSDNQSPRTEEDHATTDEDTSVTVDVLANDDDPEGDRMSVHEHLIAPEHGKAVINQDQTITYTPDPNFHGKDTIGYYVTDDWGGFSGRPEFVYIDVASINDAPTATEDSGSTTKGAAVDIAVLGNDSDIDGDTFSVAGVSKAQNGATTILADGTIRYAPKPGFRGTDSFTYTIVDQWGATSTATVSVSVGDKS